MIPEMVWLPEPAETARKALAAALAGGDLPDAGQLRRLAQNRWSDRELGRIGRALRAAAIKSPGGFSAQAAAAGLTPVRLKVFSSRTFAHMADILATSGLRHGLLISADLVEYEDPLVWLASHDRQDGYDAALLALDAKALGLKSAAGAGQEAEDHIVKSAAARLTAICAEIAAKVSPMLVIDTVIEDLLQPVSSIDAAIPGSHRRLVAGVNAAIAGLAAQNGFLLNDVSALRAMAGGPAWWAGRFGNVAKFPFPAAAAPFYLDALSRVIAASKGKSRRALVLDLDNTLWGGVIGDDGLDGILLSQGNALGEAHLAIQSWARALKDRGVILCVASKNSHDVAIEVFRKHPDMILREDDIALFKINWQDKAGNIRAMARMLNLGLEAFVFLDDNAAERLLVRSELPEVAVPEVGSDPAEWPLVLAAAGYFEQTALTGEDLKRSDYYRADARRSEALENASDMDAYLRSLNMALDAAPFDAVGRKRIAQLIAKSNQFNLTARRFSESEVAAMETDRSVISLQLRLGDAFGDNGMISAVMARIEGDAARIELWIMSCRVIGRGVEQAALNILADEAARRGALRLEAYYQPTPRNALVRDHFASLGFESGGTDAEGRSLWSLDLSSRVTQKTAIAVIRNELAKENA